MNETKKEMRVMVKKSPKLKLPFVATLISLLIMVIALFLPYISAVGDMAEYIEKNPDRIEIESLDLTASDLKRVPIISTNKVVTGVYGEEDGKIANGIVLALVATLIISSLFAVLKKPIGVMLFDLLTGGIFFFLNTLMKDVFISDDRYAWGVGYYILLFFAIVTFGAAIWLLVTRICIKQQIKRKLQTKKTEE